MKIYIIEYRVIVKPLLKLMVIWITSAYFTFHLNKSYQKSSEQKISSDKKLLKPGEF